MNSVPGDGRAVVVLGGAGTVGRWVVRHLLEPADTVVLVDRVGPVDHRADVLLPGPDIRAAVASAAMVVLALPEDVALRCLAWLPMTVRADAVLVSTCSVQEPLFAEIDAGEQSPQLLGVNPMFAPTLASRGRPVALISRAPGPEVERLRRRLDEDGMVVTELTPHAHDLVMSYLQTLPHAAVLAFLGVLTDAPVDLPALLALAPPPARTLIALGCRILSAPPETYWDIQRANASGAVRRRDLRRALDRLDETVRAGQTDRFEANLAAASRRLGSHVAIGAEQCRQIFGLLRRVAVTAPREVPQDSSVAVAHLAVFGDLFDMPERVGEALGDIRITAFVQRSRMATCTGLGRADAVIVLPDDTATDEWTAFARQVDAGHRITHGVALVDHLAIEAATAFTAVGIRFHQPDTMTAVCDNAAMRRALDRQGRYPVPHRCVSHLSTARDAVVEIGLPCVVKAVRSGDASVTLVRSREELAAAYLRAAGDGGPVLVERFLAGPLYGVATISEDAEHLVLAVARKYVDPLSLVGLGHLLPAPLTDAEREAVARCATDLLDAVQLEFGLSHTEVVLGPTGPRPIGTWVGVGDDDLWPMVQAATGVDVATVQRDQILSRPVLSGVKATLAAQAPRQRFQAVWYGASRAEGTFEGLTVPGQVRTDDRVTVTPLAETGSALRVLASPDDRVFKVRAAGASAVETLDLAVTTAGVVAAASGLVIQVRPGHTFPQ